MRMAILSLVLWPKNRELPKRIVPFMDGRVNVITGDSRSGKSAVTWIIDYALGSDKCSIPVGIIRDTVEWFGLHLRVDKGEMVVARRNPGTQQSTNELFLHEGAELAVPDFPEKNSTVEAFKTRLNQLARLPMLDLRERDDEQGYADRPSIRDMAAFNFQPQHIVANPYTLFFKADTSEHREKLKVIFPFVLGAVNAEDIANQRRLKELERALEKERRALALQTQAVNAWRSEVFGFHARARELGLLPDSEDTRRDWPFEKFIADLTRAAARAFAGELPSPTPGRTQEAVRSLVEIRREDRELVREIGLRKSRLARLEGLSRTVTDYTATLAGSRDRFAGQGWFRENIQKGQACPVCHSTTEQAFGGVQTLVQLADEVQELTGSLETAPPIVDKEAADLREEVRELEGRLTQVRRTRSIMEEQAPDALRDRQRLSEVFRLAGRIEQALDGVRAITAVGELPKKIQEIEANLQELRTRLDPVARERGLQAALSRVAGRIGWYGQGLNLERARDPIALSIKDLTLRFSSEQGRSDFLWEIGSGENWVGYHFATLLALHEHFVKVKSSPVPTFLVVDQPSQVYFPDAWPDAERTPEATRERPQTKISSDIDGVRRLFVALAAFLKSLDGNFQVIVTEHAGQITWQGIDVVHQVGNWRPGRDEPLIPSAWTGGPPPQRIS